MRAKEKFTDFVEQKIMPLVSVVSSNKILLAIRDGLILSMPVMIVGSIAIVIGDFPVPAVQAFPGLCIRGKLELVALGRD